jgi:hypothetical protein
MRKLLIFPLLAAVSAYGQSVISAKSGLIHHMQGRVLIDGKEIEPKNGRFDDVKNGQVLSTEEGLAEVLLTPGVVLRVAENASFKMVSNRLEDTRVEILTGSALVEVGEMLPENATTLLYKSTSMALLKKGLYRVDSEPGAFLVYDGEARVTAGEQTILAKKAMRIELGAVLVAGKFDPKAGDPLYRWAARRSNYLAAANISAAKQLHNQGYGSGMGSRWAWNPWFAMFTFVPGSGIWRSPFGCDYYSPLKVITIYQQPMINAYSGGTGFSRGSMGGGSYYDASVGYNVSNRGNVQSSIGSVSAPSASSSSAGGAASSSRGTIDSGARGSSTAGRRN